MQLAAMALAVAAPLLTGAVMLWTSPVRAVTWIDHMVWGGATLAWMMTAMHLARTDLLGHAGPWVLFLAVAAVFVLKGRVSHAVWRWRWPDRLTSLVAAVVMAASGGLSWLIHRPPDTPPALALHMPISSAPWSVVQGGAYRLLNHHAEVPAQHFALDLVVLRPDGRRADGLLPRSLNDYASFGLPLSAPCDGVVVARESQRPDLPIGQTDADAPAGNHLAIDCGAAIVLVAHLQQGSARPIVGEAVRAGDVIGRIGNSGNTSEPHLHLHAVAGPFTGLRDLLFAGKGLPMTFGGRFLIRADSGGPP